MQGTTLEGYFFPGSILNEPRKLGGFAAAKSNLFKSSGINFQAL